MHGPNYKNNFKRIIQCQTLGPTRIKILAAPLLAFHVFEFKRLRSPVHIGMGAMYKVTNN